MKQLISLAVLSFIMTGCLRKDRSSNGRSKFLNKKNIKSLVSEQEAKLFDIAVPFDAEPVKNWTSSDSYAYKSKMALPDLVDYLEKEMELFGWKLVTKFMAQEASLVFEKPLKYSIISIRPSGTGNIVVILNSNK